MREDAGLVIGRGITRVREGWTQGAYCRHPDGRALHIAYGRFAPRVDICTALAQASHDLGYESAEYEELRDFVTAFLPPPYSADVVYGMEHFNDAVETTVEDVISILLLAKEVAEWGGSQLPSPYVSNAA